MIKTYFMIEIENSVRLSIVILGFVIGLMIIAKIIDEKKEK